MSQPSLQPTTHRGCNERITAFVVRTSSRVLRVAPCLVHAARCELRRAPSAGLLSVCMQWPRPTLVAFLRADRLWTVWPLHGCRKAPPCGGTFVPRVSGRICDRRCLLRQIAFVSVTDAINFAVDVQARIPCIPSPRTRRRRKLVSSETSPSGALRAFAAQLRMHKMEWSSRVLALPGWARLKNHAGAVVMQVRPGPSVGDAPAPWAAQCDGTDAASGQWCGRVA
jgi:hypothetical protein